MEAKNEIFRLDEWFCQKMDADKSLKDVHLHLKVVEILSKRLIS